jgi:AcrR family transcriptional regulator
MLCLAYDETMDFASNRAEIYKESIEALLKKWDKSRGISRGQIYRNFTSKRKEEMLSAIAAETFDKEEYFLPRERIVSLIRSFISHLPEVRDHEEEEDAQAILTSIEEQHGLIVERALGIFSFSHLTFQEYFTASYVVSAGRESQRNLIRLHFEDVRWREVIILVGNLLPVADDYIIVALDKMAEIGFNGKYRDMLKEDLRSSDAGRSGKIEEKTIRVNDPQRGRYLTLVRGWGNALDIQEVREFLVEWRNGVKILSPIENFEIRSIAEQTAGKALHDFLKMSSAKASKEDSDLMEILQGMDKLFSAMANICMRIDEGRVKFHLNGYSSIEAVMKILLDGVGRDGFPWESRIGQIAAKISAKKKKKYFDVSRVSRSLEDLRKDSILRSFERRLARTIHFLSEGYNEQYREIQLLAAAETMFALISCPIYIRRETRQAALLTIFAKGSPMGSELA